MYIVIEIQNDTVLPVTVKETREEAESTYHMMLASAAISEVPVHTAVLMTNEGFVIATQCYKHNVVNKGLITEEENEEITEE